MELNDLAFRYFSVVSRNINAVSRSGRGVKKNVVLDVAAEFIFRNVRCSYCKLHVRTDQLVSDDFQFRSVFFYFLENILYVYVADGNSLLVRFVRYSECITFGCAFPAGPRFKDKLYLGSGKHFLCFSGKCKVILFVDHASACRWLRKSYCYEFLFVETYLFKLFCCFFRIFGNGNNVVSGRQPVSLISRILVVFNLASCCKAYLSGYRFSEIAESHLSVVKCVFRRIKCEILGLFLDDECVPCKVVVRFFE